MYSQRKYAAKTREKLRTSGVNHAAYTGVIDANTKASAKIAPPRPPCAAAYRIASHGRGGHQQDVEDQESVQAEDRDKRRGDERVKERLAELESFSGGRGMARMRGNAIVPGHGEPAPLLEKDPFRSDAIEADESFEIGLRELQIVVGGEAERHRHVGRFVTLQPERDRRHVDLRGAEKRGREEARGHHRRRSRSHYERATEHADDAERSKWATARDARRYYILIPRVCGPPRAPCLRRIAVLC